MIKLLLELMERQPARVVEHLVVAFWVLLRSPLYQEMLRHEQPDEEQSDSHNVLIDGAHVIEVVESNPNTPAAAAAAKGVAIGDGGGCAEGAGSRPMSRARSERSSRAPTPILKRRPSVRAEGSEDVDQRPLSPKAVRFDPTTPPPPPPPPPPPQQPSGGDWVLQSLLEVAFKWLDKAAKATGTSTDACIIKLYEFLVPSIWHYIVEVGAPCACFVFVSWARGTESRRIEEGIENSRDATWFKVGSGPGHPRRLFLVLTPSSLIRQEALGRSDSRHRATYIRPS